MKNSRIKTTDLFKALTGRFKADKKKLLIAVALIAVMAIMWVRVFTKAGPEAASAAVVTARSSEQNAAPSETRRSGTSASFVELPIIIGRNDVLSRDFFVVKSWPEFVRSREKNPDDEKEINVINGRVSRVFLKNFTKKLVLEAIEFGSEPRIFINDRFLGVGDRFFVDDGTESIECEVMSIKENSVLIRCGGTEVTLKLSDEK